MNGWKYEVISYQLSVRRIPIHWNDCSVERKLFNENEGLMTITEL